MKTISVGAIITDGTKFLIGHATGQPIWDLPKGKIEPGEDYFETCVRETKEETGFDIPETAVIEGLGVFPYIPAKNLCLFKVTIPELPDPGTFKCTSMVELPDRKPFPEVNAFMYVTKENAHKYLTKNMCKSLVLAGILDAAVSL
jgi:putative (di)nucleoside polyphosphate hydrolase